MHATQTLYQLGCSSSSPHSLSVPDLSILWSLRNPVRKLKPRTLKPLALSRMAGNISARVGPRSGRLLPVSFGLSTCEKEWVKGGDGREGRREVHLRGVGKAMDPENMMVCCHSSWKCLEL